MRGERGGQKGEEEGVLAGVLLRQWEDFSLDLVPESALNEDQRLLWHGRVEEGVAATAGAEAILDRFPGFHVVDRSGVGHDLVER